MTVFNKAVLGFNHNIRHNGQLYHVQTEDSGVNNPHIITHVFQGGIILGSKKTSYADKLSPTGEDISPLVRKMMEAQHKEMLRKVVQGAFEAPAPVDAPSPALQAPTSLLIELDAREIESLFGEDLAAEQNLDQAIRDYLAK